MTTIARVLLLSSVSLVLGGTYAHAASTVSVACSATKKLQAAINTAAAGVTTTFNVSGTCTENITVPKGKSVVIVGTLAGTRIVPKDITLPAVMSYGDTTIKTTTIQNSSGVADSLVQAELGGVLQLIGDDLTGPNTDSVVGVWDNSTATIFNTRIGDGASDAVDAANAGSIVIGANPALASGPDGAKSIISGQVFCGPGSSLFVRVRKANSIDGMVSITSTKFAAVGGNQCDLSLVNKTSAVGNLLITGGAQKGIFLNQSTLSLQKATISNNQEEGIVAQSSTASIMASTFSGNGYADISSGPGSNIIIDGFAGPSDISAAFSDEKLYCSSNGQIVLYSDAVTVPGGLSLGDLTTNNPCVTF
jgi:hypothetical protein